MIIVGFSFFTCTQIVHKRNRVNSQRNRLMRINVLATFGTLSVSSAALGASFFGMNLLSGFEVQTLWLYIGCCDGSCNWVERSFVSGGARAEI